MESPETLRKLQEIIDRSARSAGRVLRENFVSPGWVMSAGEFIDFWSPGRMASISTKSANGTLHAAPLDPTLVNGTFRIPTFRGSRRLADHRANRRCVIVAYDGPYRAVVVYGDATIEDADSDPDSPMVTVSVAPARIYAIRPPVGDPRRL